MKRKEFEEVIERDGYVVNAGRRYYETWEEYKADHPSTAVEE